RLAADRPPVSRPGRPAGTGAARPPGRTRRHQVLHAYRKDTAGPGRAAGAAGGGPGGPARVFFVRGGGGGGGGGVGGGGGAGAPRAGCPPPSRERIPPRAKGAPSMTSVRRGPLTRRAVLSLCVFGWPGDALPAGPPQSAVPSLAEAVAARRDV